MINRRLVLLLILLVMPVLAACQAMTFLKYKRNPIAPGFSGELRFSQLNKPVTVTYDEFAIPHIQAQNESDLYFALGYLHARERLFQMELLRRVAYGRLSELFGNNPNSETSIYKDTLAVDRWYRMIGLYRSGAKAVENLDENERALGKSYIAGINEYIRSGEPPIEMKLLEFEPALWTLEDVMSVARLQGWGLSLNLQHELIRFMLRAELGEEMQKEVFPPFDHPGPHIINREDKDYRKIYSLTQHEEVSHGDDIDYDQWYATAKAVLESYTTVENEVGGLVRPAAASNNWAVGPGKTKSGKPILANDPHLEHMAPCVFYMVHLKAPEIDVMGVSMAGVPAVVIGQNRHVGWAATTTMADTQDIYLEKLDPENPHNYMTPDGPVPFAVLNEIIREKGKKGEYIEHKFTMRFTNHGVVLNDLVEGLPKDAPVMALKTTLFEPSSEIKGLSGIIRAKTVYEFRDSFKHWGMPIQNWVTADDQGGIGYYPAGSVPQRVGWDGTMPVPGWNGKFEWRGMIPPEQIPQLFNPPSGFIVTANNKVVPQDDYPWPYTYDAMPGYRAERITEALEKDDKWDADKIARLQMDVYLKQGERMAPVLVKALAGQKLTGLETEAYNALKNWDYFTDKESIGASVFFASKREAWPLTLADDVSPALYKRLKGVGVVYGFFDRLWAEHPEAKIFDLKDTEAIEKRDDILVAAFKLGVANLAKHHGDDVSKWRWGDLHQLTFRHPFGSKKALAGTFNVGPYPMQGAQGTVFKQAQGWGDDFTFPVRYGPVLRMVIDFGNRDAGGMVVDLGQSGWPGSKYYANSVDNWRTGKLWPVSMKVEKYSKKALGILTLNPGN